MKTSNGLSLLFVVIMGGTVIYYGWHSHFISYEDKKWLIIIYCYYGWHSYFF
jgi:hypothetical protein